MSPKSNRGGGVHTLPDPKGSGWINQFNGKVTSHHSTKEPAAKAGRSLAKREHTEHTIHKKNGQIGSKNSYGNDPSRIRG
ncbi:MAG TPA: DUF2188 domain-containing protein [Myxococcaceae bacterium]|jgi:hypothetical protein